ncbi:MAG: hypothetical protein M3Y42_13230 [Actinomycetota bacterium]|nr:hypothetical protein [Actinomycetota bacterium]MDQ2957917.1 hypothetical protein [Actinomycetota bacterium]
MSIATDVRSYADTALAQGKVALSQAGTAVASANKRLVTDAPKPAYAALGAADLVAATVTKRVESLPAEAVGNVSKAQQTSRTLITRTQDDALARFTDLRDRLDAGLGAVSALPVIAKNTTEAYFSTAKDLYGKLTARGEAKASELRKDPRVGKLLGQVNETVGTVQGAVSPVVKSAFDTVQSVNPIDAKPVRKAPTARTAPRKSTPAKRVAAAKSTATKSAPAKSAPTKRAAAAKSAAGKTTARTTTARKATARKSTATKSTGSQA